MIDIPDARLFGRKMMALAAIVAVIVVVGVGYIAYRDHINNGRCESALGAGATWDGQDKCKPPAVHVNGLL